MADQTANSTFKQTVMGNKRVFYADVPAGGTTADLVVFPQRIGFASAVFRADQVAGSSVLPACSVSGTTVHVFQIAGTTGAAYTIRAETA